MSAGAQGWLPNLAFLPTQVGEEGAAGGTAVAAADGDAEAAGQDELVLLHGGNVRKIRPVALVAAQEDTVRHGFQQGGGCGGDQLLAVRQHHARFAQDALEEEHVRDRPRDNKIKSLKEFGCNLHNYNPYEHSDQPEFRDERASWV